MLDRDAFVAEDAADLEDAVHAADEAALEVQLEGDAQVEVAVEGVGVRLERTGRGAAGDGVQGRGLDLGELAAPEEAADRLDHAAADEEAAAGLLVDDEVEVALTVDLLGVGQAGPLLGQRAEGLRDQLVGGDADGDLAGLRAEELAADADEVAGIDELLEVGVVRVAQGVAGEVGLDDAAAVEQLDEAGLAHDAQGDDAAGDGDLGAFLDAFGQEGRAFVRDMGLVPLGAERVFAGGAEQGELLLADRMEVMGDGVEVGLFAHVGYLKGVPSGGRRGKGERFGFPCCGGGFPANNRDP